MIQNNPPAFFEFAEIQREHSRRFVFFADERESAERDRRIFARDGDFEFGKGKLAHQGF